LLPSGAAWKIVEEAHATRLPQRRVTSCTLAVVLAIQHGYGPSKYCLGEACWDDWHRFTVSAIATLPDLGPDDLASLLS